MTSTSDFARGGSAAPGNDFMTGLTDAVRENPIPAALIGMGILWLFTGGSKTSIFGGAAAVLSGVKSGVGSAAAGGYHGAERVGSMLTGGVSDAAGRIASGGAHAADAMRSAGEGLASGSADLAASARSMAGDASVATQSMGREWASSAQSSLTNAFTQQPLLLGALGLGIGAAIAAAAPVTETENRLMGDAANTFKEQAQTLMNEKAGDAKAMADRALREVQSQGLTATGAGQALRSIAETAVDVAEKAISGKAVPLSPR